MATVFIDNKAYEADSSKNVLETCLSLGLNLPYFCWHPAMHSIGACRQCAIIKYKDADDKTGKLVMACMEPVADNMHISLEASEAHEFRAGNIESLMINHPHDCPVCDEGGECHLQDMTVMSGHNYRRFDFKKRTHNNQYLGPFVNHEMNRCVQCYRCVRFYKDYAGGKDLDVFAAHDDLYFGRHEDGILENEFSGNLVEVCPTGVFTDKTLKKHFTRKWDLTNAPSICHQCSLGCNIITSERYGSVRRILTRYNGDVNGYFLCDRGRFGYEYLNSKNRIISPSIKKDGVYNVIDADKVIQEIKNLTSSENKLIGLGSPKASLESNFLLRQLVGATNFYAGISEREGKLIKQVVNILKDGHVKTPSLSEVKDYDAIFILGEDVTNTAPMLALSLRQAAKNKPNELGTVLKIPAWNDAAVREVVQGATGPFYIACTHATKLNEIATKGYAASPDDIARLGYAVAAKVNTSLAHVNLDGETESFALSITEALLASKKPLIVSGTSLYNEAIIQSASCLASALKDLGKDVGLVYVVPEANSVGLATLTDQFLESAFDRAEQNITETVVILENDLYQRMDKKATNTFFNHFKNVISLDYLDNATTQHSTHILAAATFAEADGTIINNEGRAQRFYQVHQPENQIKSSWKWLQDITAATDDLHRDNLDGVVEMIIAEFPELAAMRSLAPPADFREGTQKVPREPQRYSGRTAIEANVHISEHKPPVDADSALSFTMEGYTGVPPAAITPFYWSPGWNSVQAINKYQIEVGGELHGGNPGKRLFESKENSKAQYPANIPDSFRQKHNEWLALPIYHIFGSDELSAQSPAVKERVPQTYIALNNNDASKMAIAEGNMLAILCNDERREFRVKLNMGLPEGIVGLPKGLEETEGLLYPFLTTLNTIKNA
jgi:NADH-quinone oxidoreductase subunit G